MVKVDFVHIGNSELVPLDRKLIIHQKRKFFNIYESQTSSTISIINFINIISEYSIFEKLQVSLF